MAEAHRDREAATESKCLNKAPNSIDTSLSVSNRIFRLLELKLPLLLGESYIWNMRTFSFGPHVIRASELFFCSKVSLLSFHKACS